MIWQQSGKDLAMKKIKKAHLAQFKKPPTHTSIYLPGRLVFDIAGICYLFTPQIAYSSDVVVVSIYDTFCERMKNYDKSHLVTIKTPTQLTARLFKIVLRYVENHVEIVRQFLILKKG